MSSTTSKAAPFLGTWVFAGAASGLLFGIPLALLLFQQPSAVFGAVLAIATVLLVDRRHRRPLAAFLASFVVAGVLACVVASLLWFFSMAGQIG